MSNPWNIDANSINLNEFDSVSIKKIIVKTKDIEEFLDASVSNKKLFIVGPKGVGKTLVLKAKSQILRESHSGMTFIPSDRLCEKFSSIGVSISLNDINKFSNRQIWDKVWELSILVLILKNVNSELPLEISKTVRKASDLSEILTSFLQSRSEIDKLYKYVSTDLRPSVRDLQAFSQVAIFIDNIDEGFENHTGYNLANNKTGSAVLSEKVWISTQNSIMQVAKNICNSFKHIKIYLSIRSEAYVNNQDSTKLQLDSYSSVIKYEYKDIEKIFFNNILSTQNTELADASNVDLSFRLTGYNKITHSFVEGVNGEKLEEDLFRFIYRHTFQRPREVILMGNQIIKRLNKHERSQENVREVVNDVSYYLLNQLKNEIIPYFDDSIFAFFCQRVLKNIFTYETAIEIYTEAKRQFDFDNICSYFYRIGLIGYVDKKHDGTMIQKFLPVGEYSLSNEMLPEYKFFVLHPSINNEMKKYHFNDFYDQYNIVGYNYSFRPNLRMKRVKHVHFGLDRDSLAISIPELYKRKCLCVVVEPTHEWSMLEQCDKLTLDYNNSDRIEFLVYRENLTSTQKTHIENSFFDCHPILIYSSELPIINKYVEGCETISFSILPRALTQNQKINLSNKFVYYHHRVVVEQKIKEINKALSRFNARCIPVLIDRFLLSNEKLKREGRLTINLSVEQYGALICPERSSFSMHPSEIIVRTKDLEEFRFYKKRQHRLVEGVYQFYKILKSMNISPCENDTPNPLFNLLIYIQVRILMDKIKDDILHVLFNGMSDSFIRDSLFDFGLKTILRTNQLAKKYPNAAMIISVDEAKRKGYFPSDEYFYKYVVEWNALRDGADAVHLHNLLNVKPNSKLKTVFISYSFKDSEMAKKIFNYLVINGVKVFLFQIDDPHNRKLKAIMAEEIARFDKVLFIASKNSLMSPACQFELTTCREKHLSNWVDKILIAIRVDNYIFEVKKHEIPLEFREEYWKNIELVKEININDYVDFVNNSDGIRLQEMVRKMTEQALK